MSNVGRELDTVVMSTRDDTGGGKVDQCGAVGSQRRKKKAVVMKQRKTGLPDRDTTFRTTLQGLIMGAEMRITCLIS